MADCGSKRSTSSTVDAGHERQAEDHVEPEDVEERQDAEHDVVRALLPTGVRLALLEVREEVAVGEHGGLRASPPCRW